MSSQQIFSMRLLTHLFLMYPFSSPENIKNLTLFWCFQGVRWRVQRNKWVKKGIIKSDLSIIYPFYFQLALQNWRKILQSKLESILLMKENLASFKDQITDNWNSLNSKCSANSLYETFINIFNEIYGVNFPLTEIKI